MHDVDSEVEETIKRRVQPYFVLEGNICALLAANDHVSIFLYDGGIVPDPAQIITGGHDNQDRKNRCCERNRDHQRSSLGGRVPTGHREQSSWWLAQAQTGSSIHRREIMSRR